MANHPSFSLSCVNHHFFKGQLKFGRVRSPFLRVKHPQFRDDSPKKGSTSQQTNLSTIPSFFGLNQITTKINLNLLRRLKLIHIKIKLTNSFVKNTTHKISSTTLSFRLTIALSTTHKNLREASCGSDRIKYALTHSLLSAKYPALIQTKDIWVKISQMFCNAINYFKNNTF